MPIFTHQTNLLIPKLFFRSFLNIFCFYFLKDKSFIKFFFSFVFATHCIGMDTLRNTYKKLFKRNPKDEDEELGTKEVLELIHPKQLAPLPHHKEEDAKNGMFD